MARQHGTRKPALDSPYAPYAPFATQAMTQPKRRLANLVKT